MPGNNSLCNLSITNSSDLLKDLGCVFKEYFKFSKVLKVSGLLSCTIDEKEEHVIKVNVELKPDKESSCLIDESCASNENLNQSTDSNEDSINVQNKSSDDSKNYKIDDSEFERKDRRKSRKPKRKLLSSEKKSEELPAENEALTVSNAKKTKVEEVQIKNISPVDVNNTFQTVSECDTKPKSDVITNSTPSITTQGVPQVSTVVPTSPVRNLVINSNLASILAAAQNSTHTSTFQPQIHSPTPTQQTNAYTSNVATSNTIAITGSNGEIIGTIPQNLLNNYINQNNHNQINQTPASSANGASLAFVPNNTYNVLQQSVNQPMISASNASIPQNGVNLTSTNNVMQNTNGNANIAHTQPNQTQQQTVALIGTLGSLPGSSVMSNSTLNSSAQTVTSNLVNNDSNSSVAALLKSISDLKGLSTVQNSGQKIAVVADGNNVPSQSNIQGINLNINPQTQLSNPVGQTSPAITQLQQSPSGTLTSNSANIDIKTLASALNQQRNSIQTPQNQIPAGSIVLSYTRQGTNDVNFMIQPAASAASSVTSQLPTQAQPRISLQQLNINPSQLVNNNNNPILSPPINNNNTVVSQSTNNPDAPLSLVTSHNNSVSVKKENSAAPVVTSPNVKPLKPDFRKYRLREDPNDAEIDKILENIKGQMMHNAEKRRQKHQLILPSSSKPVKLPLQPKQQTCLNERISVSSGHKYVSRSSSADSSGNGSHRDANEGSDGNHIKAYRCHYCMKTFNRKFCRERHERLHTGVKPYTCDVCDEKFIRLEDKKRHVRGYAHYSSATALAASRNAERSEVSKREEETQILRIIAKETGKVIEDVDSVSTSGTSDLVISDGQTTQGDENNPNLDFENSGTDESSCLKVDQQKGSSTPAYQHRRRSVLKQSVQPVRISEVENHQLNVKT